MSDDMILRQLLGKNRDWAKRIEAEYPGFFERSAAEKQRPKVLWIGCADSRAPESVITESMPGEIFVHRNIANQFHLDDDNADALLTYAVEHVEVQHIIVVGHTQCGGVIAARAAAEKPPKEPETSLERWLVPLVGLVREHLDEDLTALVEANVRAQVDAIAQSHVVKEAWLDTERPGGLKIHGWVYELEHGHLRDLEYTIGKDGREF
ncbi:carbonic anhydrase [Epithele typhae]|uniref:carbonic anhydrase n=1 Tax=Epithele typhae TaxID=378194 RepID=UPI002008A0FB|nr:carbonic anhydrase [Epithele typhae]KAH9915945.1 carbonic anhydrase [Epithele typhae]